MRCTVSQQLWHVLLQCLLTTTPPARPVLALTEKPCCRFLSLNAPSILELCLFTSSLLSTFLSLTLHYPPPLTYNFTTLSLPGAVKKSKYLNISQEYERVLHSGSPTLSCQISKMCNLSNYYFFFLHHVAWHTRSKSTNHRLTMSHYELPV